MLDSQVAITGIQRMVNLEVSVNNMAMHIDFLKISKNTWELKNI